MKKILFISNMAGSRGVDNFSKANVIAAHNANMEFHLAVNYSNVEEKYRKEDEAKYGVMTHHVDFSRNPFNSQNLKAYHQLIEIIKKNKIDAVHCNTPTGGLYGRLAAKRCNISTVIYQVHGFHFFKGAPKLNWLIYYPVEKFMAQFTDYIITINKEDYSRARRFKLRNHGEVFYVPGVGIDLKTFNETENMIGKKREELIINDDDFVIISAGELNSNKNNEVIIKALHNLKNRKIVYLLCGIGDKKEYLENLVKEYGLEDNVKFLGHRSDIKELMRASDLFVMPSFREGLSRSIMEAMASGLPCVVSKIRGNVDLIEDGTGGYLCETVDVDAYAEAIRRLSDSDTICNDMKAYNLERIKKFSLELVSRKMEKIYKKVIQGE